MLQNILNLSITKQISNEDAILIGFECFFGCLWSCLIDTKGADTENTCIGGAFIRNTSARGVHNKSACIGVVFVKNTYTKRTCIWDICFHNAFSKTIYTRGACTKDVYTESTCIKNISIVKCLEIHL